MARLLPHCRSNLGRHGKGKMIVSCSRHLAVSRYRDSLLYPTHDRFRAPSWTAIVSLASPVSHLVPMLHSMP